MDLSAAYVKILNTYANDVIYTADTRAKLKQAADDLKAGRISAEDASKLSLGTAFVLLRSFQTGEAFASSVPSETIEARKAYLGGEIEELLPRLRTQGLSASIAAIEGARASGDWTAIANAYAEAQSESIKVDLDSRR